MKIGGVRMSLYRLLAADSPDRVIQMNKRTARKVGLLKGQEITLSYGMRKARMKVLINRKAAGNTLILPSRSIEKLKIVLSVTYNVRLLDDVLVIGPVIGMLYHQDGNKMEADLRENPNLYLPYAQSIRKLGGMLFFAAENQIDFHSGEMEGCVFNFETMAWERAVLPFPSILYRKVKATKALKSSFGSRLFNPPCYYKWKFFSILNKEPAFRKYLPETKNVITRNNLDRMIGKYGMVFLKPINKGGGAGMHLIWKEGRNYFARKNFTSEVFTYTSRQLNDLLASCEKNHIFQQPIHLKSYKDRKIDYRVIAVKEKARTWKVDPIIGWLGVKGGITTQGNRGVSGRYVEDLLKLQFNDSDEGIAQKVGEMKSLAIALANYLEGECGTFIDFGFDMGLDEQGDIYIFEGNTLQQLETPLSLNDHMMYGELIYCILEALKELSMEGEEPVSFDN
ncbi:YheC/YheD family protein [Neobacillus notoginsengisoli]|nr:YheC/YheD family protein [Neobacillus notoginsengisoli]